MLVRAVAGIDHGAIDLAGEEMDGACTAELIQDGEHAAEPVARAIGPQMIRERLGMTQVEFAKLIDAPLATLKNWEQGRTAVPPYVRVLLNIIDREPEAALRALGLSRPLAA